MIRKGVGDKVGNPGLDLSSPRNPRWGEMWVRKESRAPHPRSGDGVWCCGWDLFRYEFGVRILLALTGIMFMLASQGTGSNISFSLKNYTHSLSLSDFRHVSQSIWLISLKSKGPKCILFRVSIAVRCVEFDYFLSRKRASISDWNWSLPFANTSCWAMWVSHSAAGVSNCSIGTSYWLIALPFANKALWIRVGYPYSTICLFV